MQLSSLFGYVYDSVFLYAIAVRSTWKDEKPSPTTVWNAMHNITFEGLSGTVRIDAKGARFFNFVLLDYRNVSQKFAVVNSIVQTMDQDDTSTGRYVVRQVAGTSIEWPRGSILHPDEQCVLDGTVCPSVEEEGSLPGQERRS